MWQEHAIGKLGQPFHGGADADEAFDAVVVGLHVRVTDGPVHSVAVARGSLEFVIRHAVGGASPVQSAPAQASGTRPSIVGAGRCGVRIFLAVEHDAIVPLSACVAAQSAGLPQAAVIHLVQKRVMEIFGRLHARARLQHEDLHAGFREFHGGPPAACSGAHYYCVVVFGHGLLDGVVLGMSAGRELSVVGIALVVERLDHTGA